MGSIPVHRSDPRYNLAMWTMSQINAACFGVVGAEHRRSQRCSYGRDIGVITRLHSVLCLMELSLRIQGAKDRKSEQSQPYWFCFFIRCVRVPSPPMTAKITIASLYSQSDVPRRPNAEGTSPCGHHSAPTSATRVLTCMSANRPQIPRLHEPLKRLSVSATSAVEPYPS